MSTLRETVGLNIRAARHHRGLKQCELAELVGIHWTNMNRIEQGRSSVNLDRLQQISTILDIPAHGLLIRELSQ